MRLAAWPGNQRASAVHTNVPAQHDDTDFYGDVSASLKFGLRVGADHSLEKSMTYAQLFVDAQLFVANQGHRPQSQQTVCVICTNIAAINLTK